MVAHIYSHPLFLIVHVGLNQKLKKAHQNDATFQYGLAMFPVRLEAFCDMWYASQQSEMLTESWLYGCGMPRWMNQNMTCLSHYKVIFYFKKCYHSHEFFVSSFPVCLLQSNVRAQSLGSDSVYFILVTCIEY